MRIVDQKNIISSRKPCKVDGLRNIIKKMLTSTSKSKSTYLIVREAGGFANDGLESSIQRGS